MDKRAVFLHPDGVPEIVGIWTPDIPTAIENVVLRDRLIPFASVVRVTPRAVFYKEPMTPQSWAYQHPAQQ